MHPMRALARDACVLPLQGPLREGRAWFREGLLHGFIDAEATVVVPPRYDYVDSFCEGRAWVRHGGRDGFIDLDGREVVPPRLLHALPFHAGRALVQGDDRVWRLIDREGRDLGPTPCQFVDHRYGYREDRLAVMRAGRWGFIDREGVEVVPCVYEAVGPFACARAAVQDAGLWGYVDPAGRRAVHCQFVGAEAFLQGYGRVIGPGGVGLVDPEGRMVVPCAWVDVSQRVGDGRVRVSQGSVREADEFYGCNGYVDLTGRVVIACHFDHADDFEGGRARVTTRAPGGALRSFFVDPDGRELPPP